MSTSPEVSKKPVYTQRTTCRGCGSQKLDSVLDLGSQFLPRFVPEPDSNLPRAPLHLVRCECGLLQLLHTIDQDLLFREFWYRSGINVSMREALKDLVEDAIAQRARVGRSARETAWLDIGANDGYLLSVVPEGWTKVACEPAFNFQPELEELADIVITDYFSAEATNGALFDVITSAAMFYDLDDPGKFLDDIRKSLDYYGVWVNQINDSPTMMKANAFDSICLPPGGLVIAERGMVPIADIREGERVLTHRGRYMPVVETMSREHVGELVRLRAYGLGSDTVLTENHPVLVERGGVREWVPAGDVVIGDRVGRPVVSERHDVSTVMAKHGNGRAGLLDRAIDANEDLFKIAGYYLAEGFVHKASTSVAVSFTFGLSADEVALAKDCADRIARLGFTVRQHRAATSNVVTSYGGIARWLKTTFGTGSAKKAVPAWVLMLPESKVRALYDGYMAGDGYAYRENYMRGSTISDEIAIGMAMVANRLGYCASINRQKRSELCVIGGRSVTQQPLWDVLVRQKTVMQKQIKSIIDEDFQWGLVRSATREPYSGTVHNISVADDNSYVTPGMTVHNCHEHQTYYDLHTLENLYRAHGLSIVSVSHNDVNGGSMRVTARLSAAVAGKLAWTTADVPGVTMQDCERFAKRIHRWKGLFTEMLERMGPNTWGYGASTKGSTLLQYLDRPDLVTAIADRNPRKWGLRMVGSWTPIFSEDEFRRQSPKHAIVLPWAFASEFDQREVETRAAGTAFIYPLPDVRVVL